MLAQWLLQWKIITIAQESSANVGNVGDKVPDDPVDHLSDEDLELAIAREEERQAPLRKRISRARDKKRLRDLQQGTKRLEDEVYKKQHTTHSSSRDAKGDLHKSGSKRATLPL